MVKSRKKSRKTRDLIEIINSKLFEESQKAKPSDFLNERLYELCRRYPKHDSKEEIIAKTIILGRVYAASLERRRSKKTTTDDFYNDIVAPAFMKLENDNTFEGLKGLNEISGNSIDQIFTAHYRLTTLIEQKGISKQNDRSFASKYLHFHFPNIFFIYDSRSRSAFANTSWSGLKKLKDKIPKKNVDKDYAVFVYKCLNLQLLIEKEHRSKLTPRQIDNFLIALAKKRPKPKQKRKKARREIIDT